MPRGARTNAMFIVPLPFARPARLHRVINEGRGRRLRGENRSSSAARSQQKFSTMLCLLKRWNRGLQPGGDV